MKKIYENEKRLQAGDHSLDLLAHDFKKNYNMYIFPVHWQFGQLDQHPADGYVTGRGGAYPLEIKWGTNLWSWSQVPDPLRALPPAGSPHSHGALHHSLL